VPLDAFAPWLLPAILRAASAAALSLSISSALDSSSARKKNQILKGLFLTGNSGGGRPTGARNNLSEDFLQTIAADFGAR